VKILHIIGLAHGGAGQHVLSVATGCNSRLFESSVAMAEDNPMRTQFERAGVRVLPLPMTHSDTLRRNVAAFGQLSGILRREPFDLINTHTMVPSILGRVAARRNTQAIVVHMLHAFAGQRFRSRLARRVAVQIERRMDRLTDWYIAGSQAMINRGLSQRIFTADKVVLIPNGVDLRMFASAGSDGPLVPRSLSHNQQTTVIVGFLGRLELDRQKGVEHLIRAAAIVRRLAPRVRFRIGGDGPLRPELERLAARLRVSDIIEFVGWQRDRIKFLREIDFMAMPSIWEAFGLSAAEAMTLEKPVVASHVEGLPEVVGDTGILVPPANPEALASAIVELSADPARQRALGRQARARVEKRFTLELMISRHEEFYMRAYAERMRERLAAGDLSSEMKTERSLPASSSCERPDDPSISHDNAVRTNEAPRWMSANTDGRLPIA
jgi:glycosyltransferase involved in cell wall biosynthesis